MKIETIHLNNLRNNEHFQLQTEFHKLVTESTPQALKIELAFAAYLPLYAKEDEALVKITKSAFSADIEEADRRRDQLFRGMADANLSALNHFKPEVSAAARRLQIVFDTYGNVAAKPLNEETSALNNLLQDLRTGYAAEVEQVGLGDWARELLAANAAFEDLVHRRYGETSQRSDLVLKEVRMQVDAAYNAIAERVNALMLLEGSPTHKEFIRRLNAVVEKYKNLLAQRRGRNAAKAGKEKAVLSTE